MPENNTQYFDYYADYGYDDDIPWPENMPQILQQIAKRLDIYKKKAKIEAFFTLQLDLMETHAKTSLLFDEITEEDLYTIFAKIGLWVPDEYLYVFDKRATPQNKIQVKPKLYS